MYQVSAEKLEKNNLTKNIDETEIKPIEEPQEQPKKVAVDKTEKNKEFQQDKNC